MAGSIPGGDRFRSAKRVALEWSPQSGSNRHWTDFKSAASANWAMGGWPEPTDMFVAVRSVTTVPSRGVKPLPRPPSKCLGQREHQSVEDVAFADDDLVDAGGLRHGAGHSPGDQGAAADHIDALGVH